MCVYIYIYIYDPALLASIWTLFWLQKNVFEMIYSFIYISSSDCAASTYFLDFLSCHMSLSSITSSRSSRLHPVSVHSCCKLWFVSQHRHVCVQGSIGEHHLWVCPCFSSSVPCLVYLIWMVSEIGVRWPYSCYFMRCCFQDLFNIACSILVQFPFSFFSIRFFTIRFFRFVMQPYSRIDTTVTWKKLHLILSDRSNF